jgi:hypothetical protein
MATKKELSPVWYVVANKKLEYVRRKHMSRQQHVFNNVESDIPLSLCSFVRALLGIKRCSYGFCPANPQPLTAPLHVIANRKSTRIQRRKKRKKDS